jgi:hypothetical protein
MPTPPPKATPAPKNTAYTMQRRLVSAKSHEFELISDFTKLGYRNREDITILPPGVLVYGSFNVVTETTGRIGVVKGYTLDGQAASFGGYTGPMTSAYDFTKLETDDTHIRTHNQSMEIRYVSPVDGHVFWIPFYTSLNTGSTINYASYWDTASQTTQVIFVNQDSNIYQWGGGVASIASTTSNSITKEGTDTWAQDGFDEPAIAINYDLIVFTPSISVTGQISAISLTAGGSGYTVGDVLDIIGGAGGSGSCTVASIAATSPSTTGPITSVVISTTGQNYITDNNANTSGGTGTGAIINIQAVTSTITPATISDPTLARFATAGFGIGQSITVSGSAHNNGTYTITDFNAATITVGYNQTLVSETALVSIVYLPSVIIQGTTYTYTGGVNTTTLTGLSGVTDYVPGTGVTQTVKIFSNAVTNGLSPSFRNDLVGNLDNQIFIGSTKSSVIYTSNVNNFLDYSYDSPRLQGQGWSATVAGYPMAFINQEDNLYVSVGKDLWYRTNFIQTTNTTTVGASSNAVSVSIVYETLQYEQLKTTFQQAAQSQNCITKIKNDITYLSFEPIINTFGRVDDILLTPQITDQSYSIVNDMNNYDFTDACMIYFRQFLYLSIPKEGIIRIYNMTQPKVSYWEAPVTYPIGFFSIIDDELYGHGYLVPETYKLFDGYSFNGNAISNQALFSYNNFGSRFYPKTFNLFYLETYMGITSNLDFGFNYDIDGCMTQKIYHIAPSSKQLCKLKQDPSFGKSGFGARPFSGLVIPPPHTSNTGLPPKFRGIKQVPNNPFYEMQLFISSAGTTDQQWSLVACGPNAKPASEGTNSIQF